MSEYMEGVVDVTNSSATVVGNGTSFLSYPELVGGIFTKLDSDIPYFVASITDDTHLELTGNYSGATESAISYTVSTGFTSPNSIPFSESGDTQPATVYKAAMARIQALFVSLLGGGGVFIPASSVSFTPSGNLSSTEVQSALEELDSEKLDLADIGVTVQAYNATILFSGDIGVTVQGYDVNTVIDASYVHTDNNYLTVDKTKVGFISITQAVDLDDIEARVNNLDAAVVLKGEWDASVGTFPGAGVAQAGWSYIVTTAGTVDGIAFSVNDRVVSILDNASTTVYASNWLKLDYTDQVLSVDGLAGAVDLSGIYQALDAGLTSISGLTTAADKMIYTTGVDTYAVAAITAFGRSLIDDADAATARATLELNNVTNDAQVKKIASAVDNTLPRMDGTTGDLIQGSGVIVDDDDNLYGNGTLVKVITATSYTIIGSDRGKTLVFTAATAVTVTIPQTTTEAIAGGFQCILFQEGAGQVTLVAEGTDSVVSKDSNLKLTGVGSPATLMKRVAGSPNTYLLMGDLSA